MLDSTHNMIVQILDILAIMVAFFLGGLLGKAVTAYIENSWIAFNLPAFLTAGIVLFVWVKIRKRIFRNNRFDF